MPDAIELSRRERQIMDVIYASGPDGATATDVTARMPDAPSQTAVRTFLRILVDKGHLTHRKSGRKFIYQPTRARQQAGRSAFKRLLTTFFGGSIEEALAAYVADPKTGLSAEQIQKLRALIDEAARKGR